MNLSSELGYPHIVHEILDIGVQCPPAHKTIAVSSSPRPWIDAIALPKKPNMAVTKGDHAPKVRKMSIVF